MRIIVYGTLKKGGALSSYMFDSEYVGKHTVTGFKMYDTGFGYPFIARSGKDDFIQGEEYKIDSLLLRKLDMVEGVHSGLFERVDLMEEKPSRFKKPTYLYISDADDRWGDKAELREVKGGFWKPKQDG